MFKAFRILVLTSLFFLALSCRTSQISQTSHDVGRLTNDPSPWQWQAQDRETFLRKNEHRLAYLNRKAVPLADPRNTKVLTMVRKIHQTAQRLDGKTLPLLEALVVESREATMSIGLNASAWDVRSCFKVSINAQALGSGAAESVPMLSLNLYDGSLRSPFHTCTDAKAVDSSELPALAAWLMVHLPACSIEPKGDTLLFSRAAEGDCPVDRATTTRLELPQMVNWITVNSGLLDAFSEPELYAVLSHEAAHYYLAHAVQPMGAYSYFFANDLTRPGKPIRDPALEPRGRAILEAVKTLRPNRSVEGAVYNPLIPALVQDAYVALNFSKGAGSFCKNRWNKDVACTESCQDLFRMSSESHYFRLIDDLKTTTAQVAPAAYREVERAAIACHQGLVFPSLKAQTKFLEALNGKQAVLGLPLPKEKFANFHDYLLSLDMPALIAAANAVPLTLLTEETVKQDLGYYTKEVEADELGMELFVRMGFDPKVMIEAYVKLAEDEEALGVPLAFSEVGGKACRDLMTNDWPQRPPVARFLEEHLSPCYRAFNLAQEGKRHEAYYAEILKRSRGQTAP